MEHRDLGGTGLTVSRMGIGLAALGRPGYINLGHAEDLATDYGVDAMRRRTAAVLDAAWDAGITYVDAARSYGRAEQFLASWLHGLDGGRRPVVGSKWGYAYTGRWRVDADTHEVKEHSLAMFERQRVETEALLGSALERGTWSATASPCSRPSRRPGTRWNRRPAPCCRPRPTPAWASS